MSFSAIKWKLDRHSLHHALSNLSLVSFPKENLFLSPDTEIMNTHSVQLKGVAERVLDVSRCDMQPLDNMSSPSILKAPLGENILQITRAVPLRKDRDLSFSSESHFQRNTLDILPLVEKGGEETFNDIPPKKTESFIAFPKIPSSVSRGTKLLGDFFHSLFGSLARRRKKSLGALLEVNVF